jgi:PleD family two-component response regulator
MSVRPVLEQMKSSRYRILLVDDHELVRKGLRSLLDEDWEICGEAANGAEAVGKVRELKPDLVLLDLGMPVMGGTEAARAIRSIAPETNASSGGRCNTLPGIRSDDTFQWDRSLEVVVRFPLKGRCFLRISLGHGFNLKGFMHLELRSSVATTY